ncbi:protein FAM47E-like [Watersipora subatra]|uniref:protein FAM47E-like n=1 Tax=Watersipora subatra TaxID=2589382 RepID=UPI00355C0D55
MSLAEQKYNLLLVNTLKDKAIQEQPWYKERIRTKLIKSMDPNSVSKFLNTKDWTFVKDGLDDFRDGLPPAAPGGDIIQRPRGLAPSLTGKGSEEKLTHIKDSVNKRRFTKEDICYSSLTPLQKQRREHIDEMEFGLIQHPLALYPHLEEGVPPDLFEDIVDLLDPEMNMASDDEDAGDDDSIAENLDYPAQPEASVDPVVETKAPESQDTIRNLYKWLPKKDETVKKNKKKSQEQRPESPSQDKHIKDVTQDFCSWVADLGGESNNIEESTIYSLFASGYETKPALSVPIHVVELTNVPPELRMSAAASEEEETKKSPPKAKTKKKEWSYTFGNYEPSWAGFNYGAWYLPAKTWKKRALDEPLVDPKQLKEQDQTEMKKKSDLLDAELAPIHGSSAFMEFIDKKNGRRPEFLGRVSEIQEKSKQEEEKLRLEQEAKARSMARRLAQSQTA